MLLILVLLAFIIGISLIGKDTNEIEEYCDLECDERKLKKHNYCC